MALVRYWQRRFQAVFPVYRHLPEHFQESFTEILSFEDSCRILEEAAKSDDSDFVEGGIDEGISVRQWLLEAANRRENSLQNFLPFPKSSRRIISVSKPFLIAE